MVSDVMERLRPSVSLSALDDLLMSEYRLKITESFELNSHEDRNFHVVCQKLEPLEEIAVENLNSEKYCPKNCVWTASELRNGHQGVSNSTAISQQSLENDTCFDWLSSTNASSSVHDVSTQFEGLVKVTFDESWSAVHLDDCKSISRVERLELQMKVASHLRNCGFVCPEAVMSVTTGSLVQELTVNCDGEVFFEPSLSLTS